MLKSKLIFKKLCLYSIKILLKKSIIKNDCNNYLNLLNKDLNGNHINVQDYIFLKKGWFDSYPNICRMKKHLDNRENYLNNNPFSNKEKGLYWRNDLRATFLKERLKYAGSFGGGEAYAFGNGKKDPYDKSVNTPLNKFLNDWKIRLSTVNKDLNFYNIVCGNENIELDSDNIFKELEIRFYKVRCVEGFSMGIKYIGIPFDKFIKKYGNLGNKKPNYVNFISPYRPDIFVGQQTIRGQQTQLLSWPYQTGVRFDEATHRLAFFVIGILDNNNVAHPIYPVAGGPFGIVFPWKYCIKSLFGIRKIDFQESKPTGSWEKKQPREYGFYSNVNPNAHHPRWTQTTERVIGEDKSFQTEMFNGYAKEVSNLYTGMDLKENY